MSILMRPALDADAGAAAAIHAEGVATGEATFRAVPYTPAQWLATYDACRIVAERDGGVIGWAGATRLYPARAEYAGVGSTSVYVRAAAAGGGVGTALMRALAVASEEAGFWTLWAHVFAHNKASIALHRAAGFRILGVRERVGRMGFGPHAGEWRDVVVMERRSTVVGVD